MLFELCKVCNDFCQWFYVDMTTDSCNSELDPCRTIPNTVCEENDSVVKCSCKKGYIKEEGNCTGRCYLETKLAKPDMFNNPERIFICLCILKK